MFSLIPFRGGRDVSVYNPFRDFEDFEKGFWGSSPVAEFKTDIRVEDGNYVLEADLPGFKKEDISVNIDDNNLTITAQRSGVTEQKDKKGGYIRRERSFGSFARSFDVSGVRADEIKAAFDNGVLTLTMPKAEPYKPTARRLEIE